MRKNSDYPAQNQLQVDAVQLTQMRRSRKIFLVAGEFYAMQAREAD